MAKFGRTSASNSFIDSATSIVGDLQFSGELRIDGELHGSIKTSDSLIVGEKATVQADICAGEVRIFGKVLGNVNCDERVEIAEGGHLQGDVQTTQLIIHEGATFEGLSRPATESTAPVLERHPEVEMEQNEVIT
jgi:cytoskeletal protein CcmA (bactofilin family)